MSELLDAGPRVFVWTGQRVRFHEVDHAGIVFFAKFYEYCHIAYEEFIEQVGGYGPNRFFRENDFGAPLVATRSSHHHPLFHGDRLTIRCWVAQLGRSSMTMRYEIRNEADALCATVYTRHAFISRASFRAIEIPDDIRAALAPYLRAEDLAW